MSAASITLSDIQNFLSKRFGVTAFKGLPATEVEFAVWWNQIAVSPDLVDRWKQRVQSSLERIEMVSLSEAA